MIYRRKAYERLLKWKNVSNGSSAMLIQGAKCIGKTTICKQFGENEYKSYILVDCEHMDPELESLFDRYLHDLELLFKMLEIKYNTKLYERESLIIFDEVQKYPKVREAIKYLVKDGRYDYVETGSLISIKENVKDIVIPSEEESFKMYPMDFEEFAWAFKEDMLIEYIKECFEKKEPLDRSLHNKAMILFKEYMLVGGMPKVVSAYLENDRSFEKADVEKRKILRLYRNDIMKIERVYRSKVLAIYDRIPLFLSNKQKRIVFRKIQEGTYAKQYEDTLYWLKDSMIVNECFLTRDPNVGLSLNEDRTYIKCYMGDTGLLVSHTFDENELLEESVYKDILNGKLSINQGMLYENVIAQMLVSNNYKLYFYTHYNYEKKRNDIEIDFIISNNSKLKYQMYPIEVKSSKKFQANSIAKFSEKFKQRIGDSYVISPNNLKHKDGMIYIPCYMTFCL